MRVERDWLRKLVFESPEELPAPEAARRGVTTKRFTQDSPILPEVWLAGGIAYCRASTVRVDLLLTPHRDTTASILAARLRERLRRAAEPQGYDEMGPIEGPLGKSDAAPIGKPAWTIAASQTTVAASLTFRELVVCVLPLSPWWQRNVVASRTRKQTKPASRFDMQRDAEIAWLAHLVEVIARCAERPTGKPASQRMPAPDDAAWVTTQIDGGLEGATVGDHREFCDIVRDSATRRPHFEAWRKEAEAWESRSPKARGEVAREDLADPNRTGAPLLWAVSLNRQSPAAIRRSVPATKSDAARRVFDITVQRPRVGGRRQRDRRGASRRSGDRRQTLARRYPSRVQATYDFTRLRTLLSLGLASDHRPGRAAGRTSISRKSDRRFKQMRARLRSGAVARLGATRAADRAFPMTRSNNGVPNGAYRPAVHDHGTHVAGIIGACDEAEELLRRLPRHRALRPARARRQRPRRGVLRSSRRCSSSAISTRAPTSRSSTASTSACRSCTTSRTSPADARRSATNAIASSPAASSSSPPPAIAATSGC